MNSHQAKQISLQDILTRLGYAPAHEKNGEIWYASPFREEADPSFKINLAKNIWYDFGEGAGGTVLDFALKYYQLTSIRDALRELDQLVGDMPLFPQPAPVPRTTPAPTKTAVSAITVQKIQPLQNAALIGYLRGRGIAAESAKPYVQEMYYRREGKLYFSLVFANESGGYELRNPYFKGVHGRKDITLIKTAVSSPTVAVFEGFIDFLSYLTHEQTPTPSSAVIILNSTAMRDRAVQAIKELGVTQVDLYLDHDESGRSLTQQLQEELTELTVSDQSSLYAGHHDYNAYLCAMTRQSARSR